MSATPQKIAHIVDPDQPSNGPVFFLTKKMAGELKKHIAIKPTEHQPMVPIGFMAAPDLHDRIMAATKAHKISISEFCREALGEFLNPSSGCCCGECGEPWDGVPSIPPAPGTMEYRLREIYGQAIVDDLNNSETIAKLFTR